MSESIGIDSPGGPPMPQSYSGDLRERVIGTVEAGASRREAADLFEISISSAIRWVQRWREEGSSEPKPRGGSRSTLEDYAGRILALVAEHPDWTLDEILAAMHKQRIPGSRTALWRFLDRHGLTFKKKVYVQPSDIEPTWRERVGAGFGSKASLIRRGWCLSTRRRSPRIWSVSGVAARAA